MGLYIDKAKNPDIYKNDETIHSTNQTVFTTDLLKEWKDEQMQSIHLINEHLKQVEHYTKRQNKIALHQNKRAEHRYMELINREENRKVFEIDILRSVKNLNTKQHLLQSSLTNNATLNRTFANQVKQMNLSKEEVNFNLTTINNQNKNISEHLQEQFQQQRNLSHQLDKLEKVYEELLKRLDNQEGLLEKLIRQIDNIRSIIFERTHFIVEKFERASKLTSVYRSKLKGDSKKSIKLQKINQTDEKNN